MKKKFLRNYDLFFEYLDIDTNKVLKINKNISTIGYFSTERAGILKIYVNDGKINVSLNDLNIIVNEYTECRFSKSKLIISDSFSSIQVDCHDCGHLEDNPFYKPLKEDNNLCLLIFNILNNKSRKLIFIENNLE